MCVSENVDSAYFWIGNIFQMTFSFLLYAYDLGECEFSSPVVFCIFQFSYTECVLLLQSGEIFSHVFNVCNIELVFPSSTLDFVL